MSEQHFTPEMTVDQAFRVHAGARRVFARFHLGGCSNCAISETHTIGAISEDYGIPLPMLLENLNALFDQAALAIGTRCVFPTKSVQRSRSWPTFPRLVRSPEWKAVPIPPSSAKFGSKDSPRIFSPVEASAARAERPAPNRSAACGRRSPRRRHASMHARFARPSSTRRRVVPRGWPESRSVRGRCP